jgi:DNA-binding NarL/FixJ family response regulator
MVNLCGSLWESMLSPEDRAQVQTLLAVSLASLLAGYRMKRIFGQATAAEMQAMLDSNLVRQVASFPEGSLSTYLATEQVASAQPFSIQRSIFNYRKPVLHLSEGERELLCAALEGQTDTELAVSLRLTLPAVKARWRSVFTRFAKMEKSLAPEFFGQGGRGPQKRHRILAYLREHPEELRPFDE